MSIFSCAPGSWTFFQDPEITEEEELKARRVMKERIRSEPFHQSLNATEYETNDCNLQRILRNHYYDTEVALNQWHLWVSWKHENMVDSITESDIAHERTESILAWRGKNKENMACCVVTGRFLDPTHREGSHASFRKFIIKTVEDGMRDSNESEQDKVCVIYDRRGLEFQHIDPNLYQFCRSTIDALRMWYSDRLGVLYVLHTNTFFWILYLFIIKPFLAVTTTNNRLIVVEFSQVIIH
mmetsp:Transcript_1227/g.1640  ORF Transcript_1227/g.1640 Transcript_1227/m.1640 type:complete len:240 (-) Transcript_1227:308-1027(-)